MDSSSLEGEEFLLLHRVAQRINSVLDLSFVLKQIVSDVAHTFGYCRSAVKIPRTTVCLLLDRDHLPLFREFGQQLPEVGVDV